MKTLDEIGKHYINEKVKHNGFSNYGGDRSSNDNDYLVYYDEIFSPYRDKKIRLLEIGVLQGKGLLIWDEYFKNVIITGIDIDIKPCLVFLNDRGIELDKFNLIEGDSTNLKIVKKLPEEKFHIIIDDGNHLGEAQYNTFLIFFNKLHKGGLYIIEDTHDNKSLEIFLEMSQLINQKGESEFNAKSFRFTKSDIKKYHKHIEYITFTRRRIIIKKFNTSTQSDKSDI